MGFLHKTSKQTAKLKSLLGLAVSRIAVARRPRLARKSIACSDVSQLLVLGHLNRALHRAEQVIQEDNMLEAFGIIELYCKRLIEQAEQLDKPQECGEELREAAASIMFAAGWCGDLQELLFARTILADKFGGDFAVAAKEGTGIVDPILVWKLSGSTAGMELKKKVTKEIAAENNILVDFSELPEATEDGNNNVPDSQELLGEMPCQDDMDESSESDNDHPHSHGTNTPGLESDENVHIVTNSDGSDDEVKGRRNRRWWRLGCA
uniref:IST1-like protein n=1 Tax=Aegilops tauschii subsp. strangulata TaxID=200361 RepID=A0A453IGW2_AEGTS